jgi:hypothetical protein
VDAALITLRKRGGEGPQTIFAAGRNHEIEAFGGKHLREGGADP